MGLTVGRAFLLDFSQNAFDGILLLCVERIISPRWLMRINLLRLQPKSIHTVNDYAPFKAIIGRVGDEEEGIDKGDQANLASPLLFIDPYLPGMDITFPSRSAWFCPYPSSAVIIVIRIEYIPITLEGFVLDGSSEDAEQSMVRKHDDDYWKAGFREGLASRRGQFGERMSNIVAYS